MKHFIISVFVCMFVGIIDAQTNNSNLALHLDGKDNNVRTGIGFIYRPWTLEAWIKGDDTTWKSREVIFGGGEYSKTNRADYLPLVIENGRLHSTWGGLWSENVLDNMWHHVALSCDGFVTRLYLDGEVIDSRLISFSILPGTIGVNENDSTIFGGLIDEVRVWNECVSTNILKDWMSKPLSPAHPNFTSLVAYYNFDDGFADDVSVNWVGIGDQAFHLRNGRIKYQENTPLAYTIINDNTKFIKPVGKQEVFNSVVIESEWDANRGIYDDQILKLRIAITGNSDPLSLTELRLDLSEVTDLSDISYIHVYYTGKHPHSSVKKELFGKGVKPEKNMVLSVKIDGDNNEAAVLTPGINYFLVTADISEKAKVGNTIKISVPSFSLNNKSYIPQTYESAILKKIDYNSQTDRNIVKVLQWNIWHGGNHLGTDGPTRIIELIKKSDADIITMQEGYGTQHRIHDSLRYYMQTPSPNDNLVLFSRYPIETLPTYRKFNSNPNIVTLPNKQRLLVNACWLRFANDPEYTCDYPCVGHNVDTWIVQDSLRGLVDAKYILENDTKPYLKDPNMPVIIGGDFNSCSHLDWTQRAASLHFGYGPVEFPISKYMFREGYKDSFREMNPNEVTRPEGTFAVIYGQLRVSRIDFLYYKGDNIRAISSKIVKTAPEIDDVWASDHAAVLTTFKLHAD